MTAITISGLEEVIESIDGVPKDVRDADRIARKTMALYIQGELREDWSVDTNFSRKRIEYELDEERAFSEVSVGFNEQVEYAEYVEKGRAPGVFPNLQSITQWLGGKRELQSSMIREFLKKPTALIQRQSIYNKLNSRQKSMVFIIARSIAVNGTEGLHVFEDFKTNEIMKAMNVYMRAFEKNFYD